MLSYSPFFAPLSDNAPGNKPGALSSTSFSFFSYHISLSFKISGTLFMYGFYSRILYDTERDVFTLERVPVKKG